MSDLQDGETVTIASPSGSQYQLKQVAGVYSCSCPAWRNQSVSIDRRTCKHLRQFRGEAAEQQRLGGLAGDSGTSTHDVPAATKPSLLLAHSWDGEQNVADWWLSEKLDGVRAYWTGSQFMSRAGNTFHAPAWFTAGLPTIPLDGELWLDRKQFQTTVSIVRRQDAGEAWRRLSYVMFDGPHLGGPFEERQQQLRLLFGEQVNLFAKVLPQTRCRGGDHLHQELNRIEALGGEGIMLRQPNSQYEPGRSATLLKVKRFLDAEALVVGHQPGTGRHRGRLGALLVELPNGIRFAVGTGFTDAERNAPAAIGSQITFRYQELTDGGVPRFPSFVRRCRTEPADVPRKARR